MQTAQSVAVQPHGSGSVVDTRRDRRGARHGSAVHVVVRIVLVASVLGVIAGAEQASVTPSNPAEAIRQIEDAYGAYRCATQDTITQMKSRLDAAVHRCGVWPLLSPAISGEGLGDTLTEGDAARLLGLYQVREAIPALVARFKYHMIDRVAPAKEEDIAARQEAVPGLVFALAAFKDPELDDLIEEAARVANPISEVQRYAEFSLFNDATSFPSDRYDLVERLIPSAERWVRSLPDASEAERAQIVQSMRHRVKWMREQNSRGEPSTDPSSRDKSQPLSAPMTGGKPADAAVLQSRSGQPESRASRSSNDADRRSVILWVGILGTVVVVTVCLTLRRRSSERPKGSSRR